MHGCGHFVKCISIVVIALTMVISFKLIGAGISLFDGKNIVTSMVDGFWDALNSLFTMILVTAAVKLQCISVKGDGIINVINVPDFGTGKGEIMGKFAAEIERVITIALILSNDADTYTGSQRTGKSKKM